MLKRTGRVGTHHNPNEHPQKAGHTEKHRSPPHRQAQDKLRTVESKII